MTIMEKVIKNAFEKAKKAIKRETVNLYNDLIIDSDDIWFRLLGFNDLTRRKKAREELIKKLEQKKLLDAFLNALYKLSLRKRDLDFEEQMWQLYNAMKNCASIEVSINPRLKVAKVLDAELVLINKSYYCIYRDYNHRRKSITFLITENKEMAISLSDPRLSFILPPCVIEELKASYNKIMSEVYRAIYV